jgi:hypothetical protein
MVMSGTSRRGAAQTAGPKRILIIDLDAQGGGGTHELLGTDRRGSQLDVRRRRRISAKSGWPRWSRE